MSRRDKSITFMDELTKEAPGRSGGGHEQDRLLAVLELGDISPTNHAGDLAVKKSKAL